MKSAYRKLAAGRGQPRTPRTTDIRPQEHQQWRVRQEYRGKAAVPREDLEAFVKYLPRPRQLGIFFESDAAGPPATALAVLLPFYAGAETIPLDRFQRRYGPEGAVL